MNFMKLRPQHEQADGNFLYYIKHKYSTLIENDKLVILMLDEIHLKECLEYKGGKIIGTSYDNESCATSANVYMLKSVLSQFKNVVRVLPVKALSEESLFEFIKKVILGLENIGFKVLCTITGNNAINRKAVSHFLSPPKFQFVYQHPADKNKP